nr:phage virion morphogenesis protein [Burkholderia pseudomallei]
MERPPLERVPRQPAVWAKRRREHVRLEEQRRAMVRARAKRFRQGGEVDRRLEPFATHAHNTSREVVTARYLRIDVANTGLALGIDERLSRIARVHQEGQKAPVEPGGPLARYPVRVVLGFADADRELVRDRLLRYPSRGCAV